MNTKALALTSLFVVATALWLNTARSESFNIQVPAFTVQIHKTYQEVTEACKILNPQTNRLLHVAGCWSPSTRVLHTVPPTSFCDLTVLQTLGHEVMHVIGWKHIIKMRPGVLTGTGCVLGEFTP